jgi:hypothetical protein
MSERSRERLYNLLPAVYRLRDAAEGEPLRALLAVIEGEVDRIEADIGDLYENWFIETCEEWVVPYIADLLGIRKLPSVSAPTFNQRTHVANTLSYRRQKGTTDVLARLARDLTDWRVRVVELFRHVAATQHLTLPRPDLCTVDVRDDGALTLLESPFDPWPHTADVRAISEGVVRHNLPNIALFLWRLSVFHVERARALAAEGQADGSYFFSAVGDDAPLFNPGVTGGGDDEPDLPVALRPRALSDELEAIRRAIAAGADPPPLRYFDPERPVFLIEYIPEGGGAELTVPPEEIVIADLSSWGAPSPVSPAISAAVDPLLGRLLFLDVVPAEVRVSYSYGVSGVVGAGPYDIVERAPIDPERDREVAAADPGPSLAEALSPIEWEDYARITIEIKDSDTHDAAEITVPPGKEIELRARNRHRPLISIPTGVEDSWKLTLWDSHLILDGLLIVGGPIEVNVDAGKRARLTLRRSTVVARPASSPWLKITGGGELELTLERSITEGVPANPSVLFVRDSIIDGDITAKSATIERSTVFGKVTADVLELASDTIFLGLVTVTYAQRGAARYSYILPDSITPPRYRCQPDLALSAATSAEEDRVLARVKPTFTSDRRGDPGYAQLSAYCDDHIRRGGSDGGEMGVFFHLKNLAREENLRAGLEEYVRFGYEAGIFYLT